MRGLYVHVPFCLRKCSYCDFYSLPDGRDRMDPYIDAVISEARVYAGLSFDTLYLGGGTPSILGAGRLKRFMGGLRDALDLSNLIEATIEMNPESATPAFVDATLKAGITRVSIGVQSLSDRELVSVGRVHNAARAIDAVTLCRKVGFTSVSADLMVGLPGQTWPSLATSLEKLLSLGIDHLSLYCLALEEGTPLAKRPPADLPSDDRQADLFEQARFFLVGKGFSHYEISNFAREGHECQHNLNYWRGGEYIGLGPAAASHRNGRRWKNRPDLDTYILDPGGQPEDIEILSEEDKAAEEAMLRLRLIFEGIDPDALAARFSSPVVDRLVGRLDTMVLSGTLDRNGGRYILPAGRILTSNGIFGEVMGLGTEERTANSAPQRGAVAGKRT